MYRGRMSLYCGSFIARCIVDECPCIAARFFLYLVLFEQCKYMLRMCSGGNVRVWIYNSARRALYTVQCTHDTTVYSGLCNAVCACLYILCEIQFFTPPPPPSADGWENDYTHMGDLGNFFFSPTSKDNRLKDIRDRTLRNRRLTDNQRTNTYYTFAINKPPFFVNRENIFW